MSIKGKEKCSVHYQPIFPIDLLIGFFLLPRINFYIPGMLTWNICLTYNRQRYLRQGSTDSFRNRKGHNFLNPCHFCSKDWLFGPCNAKCLLRFPVLSPMVVLSPGQVNVFSTTHNLSNSIPKLTTLVSNLACYSCSWFCCRNYYILISSFQHFFF